MIVWFVVILGLTEILAGDVRCCESRVGNSTLDDSGLCPCEDDFVLAWTYDGICDCKCIPKPNLACAACPEVLQQCAKTCCFFDVVCDGDVCRPADELDFATVAKIAVLFALIVTCLAVLVAFIRAFLLPRWCRRGRTRAVSNSDTRSLNSVQRFVVDRLRSRPPPYEQQPEKPPSYEECIGMDSESPPAYGLAVISLSSEPPAYSQQSGVQNLEHIELRPMSSGPLHLDPRTLTIVSPEPEMDDFAVIQITNPTRQDNGIENEAFEVDEQARR